MSKQDAEVIRICCQTVGSRGTAQHKFKRIKINHPPPPTPPGPRAPTPYTCIPRRDPQPQEMLHTGIVRVLLERLLGRGHEMSEVAVRGEQQQALAIAVLLFSDFGYREMQSLGVCNCEQWAAKVAPSSRQLSFKGKKSTPSKLENPKTPVPQPCCLGLRSWGFRAQGSDLEELKTA